MTFHFHPLQHKNALIIANDWKYEGPYAFYDMTSDVDDYNELVDESLRNGCAYFEATVDDELVGFFCLSMEDGEIEIGLGLKPDCCGKGIGREFVNSIIDYINEHYVYNVLSMSVASFNQRAIKVYKSCGFREQMTYMQDTNGGKYEFMKLAKRK